MCKHWGLDWWDWSIKKNASCYCHSFIQHIFSKSTCYIPGTFVSIRDTASEAKSLPFLRSLHNY